MKIWTSCFECRRTVDDYRHAVQNNAAVRDLFFKVLPEGKTFTKEFGFGKSTDVSEEQMFSLIDRHYYYAGGSARWFFTVSAEGIMKRVVEAVSRIPNLTNFACGDTGSLAPQFVNTLFQQNERGESSFVSSYVTRKLAHKMEAKFLEMARNQHRLLNPSVNGFMFEYWVILQLRSHDFMVESDDGVENWGCGRESPRFVDYKDDAKAQPLQDAQMPCWLIPEKWNQGCFDIVYVTDRSHVRLVQVTLSDSHSLNWSYVHTLMSWLRSPDTATVVYATLKPFTKEAEVRLAQKNQQDRPRGTIQFKSYKTTAETRW